MKTIAAILFTAGTVSAQLMGGNAISTGTVHVAALASASHQEGGQNAAPSRPVRIGGAVMAASLVTKVNPAYPADMKEQRQEATVVLQTVISKEGIPQSLSVQTTDVNRSFVDAALDAVKQWRYKPTLLNGEPVEVITTITINFTLSQ